MKRTEPAAAPPGQAAVSEEPPPGAAPFGERVLDFSMLTLDARGRVLSWNLGAQRFHGYAAAQIVGRSWEALFPPEEREQGLPARLLEAAGRDGAASVEGWWQRSDGRRFWNVGSLYPLPEHADGPRLALISRDMSEAYDALRRLADSEARLALALDGARMGSWHWDVRNNTSRWNAREYELLGLPVGDGHADAGLFYQHVHADDLARLQRSIADALERGEAFRHEFRVVADGKVRWLVGAGRAQLDAAGRPLAMAGVNFDITQQRQAEHALRESEARLNAVISGASDAVVSTDLQGRIELFNPAAERIFGRPAAGMLGQPLDTLLPARTRGVHRQHLADFANSGVTRRAMGPGKVDAVHADGRRIELEASISQAEAGGRPVLTAILRDVTDRARAERALAHYQLELSGLAQHLLAQEKETTRRLAQSLHDDLGQTLAALRLNHDALTATMAPGTMPALLQRADRLIGDANRQVRRVLADLRPPLLDEEGLALALDNELRQQSQTHEHIALSLDIAHELEHLRWPPDVEYSAFMIAREALRNALRHANAAAVSLQLRGGPERLQVRVCDDGAGLADEYKTSRPGHLGMVGMRERALAIGATLTIDAEAGAGTRVQLNWAADDVTPLPDR